MTASSDVASGPGADPVAPSSGEARGPQPGMEWIPGGSFQMGSDRHYPEEGPAHRVTVDGFWIDRTPVTNALFRLFVEATGHVTLAERARLPGRPPRAPGSRVGGVRAAGRPRRPPQPLQLVAPRPRRRLAPPARPRKLARRPRRPPSRAGRLRGRRRLRPLGREEAPHRGGVRVRRPRRPRWRRV